MDLQKAAGPDHRGNGDEARNFDQLGGKVGILANTTTPISQDDSEHQPGSKELYRLRSIKRSRRLKTEVKSIKDAIKAILEVDNPQTVRQIFYALTVRGLINKIEGGTSVELDAIPAARLREIVRQCIERHIDQQQMEILRAAEQSERDLLFKWAKTYGGSR